jgi:hypothetical protein
VNLAALRRSPPSDCRQRGIERNLTTAYENEAQYAPKLAVAAPPGAETHTSVEVIHDFEQQSFGYDTPRNGGRLPVKQSHTLVFKQLRNSSKRRIRQMTMMLNRTSVAPTPACG